MSIVCRTLAFLQVVCCVHAGRRSSPLVHEVRDAGSPGEYIVMLQPGAPGLGALGAGGVPGIELRRSFPLGRRQVALVRAEASAVEALAALPHVQLIETNHVARHGKPLDFLDQGDLPETGRGSSHGATEGCHEDPVGEHGWGLIRTSHRARPDYAADPYVYGDRDAGQGVDVYVVDSGVFTEHDDFEGRAVHGFTAPLIPDGDADLDGHGTHVAGTAGGRRFGVARQSTLVGVKVLNAEGWGWTSDIVEGIAYCTEQHRNKSASGKTVRSVINMSLGGGRESYSYSMETAIQDATEAGLHVVVAAGNSYDDGCLYSPARSSVAVSVGATNLNDSLATFSNYGPCVNVLAPGRTITAPFIGGTRRYVSMSGTSMAAPHVAGLIARHLSQIPDDEVTRAGSPAAVRALLTDQATRQAVYLQGDVPGEVATPNRLLFKECAMSTVPAPTTETPTPATSANPHTTTPVPAGREDGELQTTGQLVLATLSVSAVMAACNVGTLIWLGCVTG